MWREKERSSGAVITIYRADAGTSRNLSAMRSRARGIFTPKDFSYASFFLHDELCGQDGSTRACAVAFGFFFAWWEWERLFRFFILKKTTRKNWMSRCQSSLFIRPLLTQAVKHDDTAACLRAWKLFFTFKRCFFFWKAAKIKFNSYFNFFLANKEKYILLYYVKRLKGPHVLKLLSVALNCVC